MPTNGERSFDVAGAVIKDTTLADSISDRLFPGLFFSKFRGKALERLQILSCKHDI